MFSFLFCVFPFSNSQCSSWPLLGLEPVGPQMAIRTAPSLAIHWCTGTLHCAVFCLVPGLDPSPASSLAKGSTVNPCLTSAGALWWLIPIVICKVPMCPQDVLCTRKCPWLSWAGSCAGDSKWVLPGNETPEGQKRLHLTKFVIHFLLQLGALLVNTCVFLTRP
jgi:hypothetical protein